MRYKDLKVTGGQRFAEPHELAYQDPERVANVGTRAEELAAWNELGFDRLHGRHPRASTTPTRACTSSSTTAGRPGSTSSIGSRRPVA